MVEPRTEQENDQAFLELIEHHRQHHAESEDLQAIRSRAEKELERSKPGSAVWQTLRWVLGVRGAEPSD